MKIPKQLITLAAMVATCGLLLAGCGGGSSAATINGISVPLEPDATENNATLAGVDSNSNGIRDDIDRYIATNMHESKSSVDPIAILTQKLLAGEAVAAEEHSRAVCEISKLTAKGVNENELMFEILNTDDRYDKYYQALSLNEFQIPNCTQGAQ